MAIEKRGAPEALNVLRLSFQSRVRVTIRAARVVSDVTAQNVSLICASSLTLERHNYWKGKWRLGVDDVKLVDGPHPVSIHLPDILRTILLKGSCSIWGIRPPKKVAVLLGFPKGEKATLTKYTTKHKQNVYVSNYADPGPNPLKAPLGMDEPYKFGEETTCQQRDFAPLCLLSWRPKKPHSNVPTGSWSPNLSHSHLTHLQTCGLSFRLPFSKQKPPVPQKTAPIFNVSDSSETRPRPIRPSPSRRRRLGRLHGPHPGAVAVVLGRRGGLPTVARAGCLGPLGARWPRGSKGRNGSGHKLMGSIDKTGGE